MKIRLIRSHQPRPKANTSDLGFGRYFADHMFLMDFAPEHGWHDPRIVPYQPLDMEPANLTLHYGQTVFEGLKAYRWQDGSVNLFRPLDHAARFLNSSRRLCMPEFDPELIARYWSALVHVDRSWVPSQSGTSLYLRPSVIAADNVLGVRPSGHYQMVVITSPVGNYYTRGAAPTRILVEEHYSRASHGGLGEAKTAANYAASLLAAEQAKKKGFDQVLWLDAAEHRWVEEVGTMNIFFVIDGTLVTPALTGSILSGITRRTVLALAAEWGVPFEERRVSIDEVIDASKKGKLQEVFGSGTAATISPVGELSYKGELITINERPDSLRSKFFDSILGICYGRIRDQHGWIWPVEEPPSTLLEDVFETEQMAGNGHHEHYKAVDLP